LLTIGHEWQEKDMATIDVGEIVRVSARFKAEDAGDVINVWRWRNDGAAAVTDTDFIAACKAKLSAAFAFVSIDLSNRLDSFDIRFDVVAFIGGKEVVVKALGTDTWTLSTPPGAATDMLPATDAVIMNFRTATPGSYGRKFLAGLCENSWGGGVVVSAAIGRFGQMATELLTALAAGGQNFSLGAISEKVGIAGEWVEFISAVINTIPGNQRRRRRNVGS